MKTLAIHIKQSLIRNKTQTMLFNDMNSSAASGDLPPIARDSANCCSETTDQKQMCRYAAFVQYSCFHAASTWQSCAGADGPGHKTAPQNKAKNSGRVSMHLSQLVAMGLLLGLAGCSGGGSTSEPAPSPRASLAGGIIKDIR
jgi:hypothetical protein